MSASSTHAARTPVAIEVRNPRFSLGAHVPRAWHPAGLNVTRFFDNLSVFFPVGERFFMASLNAHRHVVEDDPAMRRAIRDFCAQEGIHGREHDGYNAMLAEQGLPIEAMEASVARLLDRVQKRLPKRWQLAATAALEHFTGVMGYLILTRPELLEGAHPSMAELWRWHAAEENEHKAVAFDVYEAAGGFYAERSIVMLMATVIFWSKVVEHHVRILKADGIVLSPREHAQLLFWLFGKPGAMRAMWWHWLSWFRPGFHPNDVDAQAAFDTWRAGFDAEAVR
ncbi:MAG: metal-dependent hydrolase [Sandaracinus sp.]|nr:metal-dependent hydrolase [Sandaracinus sp.]MCB9619704.1 metal-dependent hydrolase [Sandaracinus sp.]MCB9624045.1 metal-dependent hydrolase [Sandaracinus sp.]